MRFIYFTDSHFKSTGPASRSDDFFKAGLVKLQWLIEYARKNDIKIILHGGDFFDNARPGFSTATPIAAIIAVASEIDFYINVGNHDLYGWNPETFERTVLCMLSLLPNVHILPDNGITLINDDKAEKHIAVHSIWSKYDREGDPTVFRFLKPELPVFKITMAHTMLVERSFFGAYVPMEQIEWGQAADLILGSHYHPGWETKRKFTSAGEIYLAHPGSFMRIMKSVEQRLPHILDITIDDKTPNIKMVPVEVAGYWPFKEDAEVIEEKDALYGPLFENFLEKLLSSSVDASAFDPRTIATAIAAEHEIPEGALKRVIRNLDAVAKER